jgi:hypothetical protein
MAGLSEIRKQADDIIAGKRNRSGIVRARKGLSKSAHRRKSW